MKIKEFLQLFSDLDPETELYFRENDHYVCKPDLTGRFLPYHAYIKSKDQIDIGKSINVVYYPDDNFDTKITVV